MRDWIKKKLYTYGNTNGLKPGVDWEHRGSWKSGLLTLIDRLKYKLWRRIK